MKRTALTLILSLTFLAPASAVTLVNPSLEDLSASYVDIAGADRMEGVAPDGWSIALNSPGWYWGEGPSNLWHTPFGDHFGMGAATGQTGSAYREGISQSVSGLTVGATYDIGFSHANGLFYNPGTPGFYEGVGTTGGWEVLIDGSSIALVSSTNDNSIAAPEHTLLWQASTATFAATATTHEIQFIAFKPDGPQDPTFQFLDDVSVTLVPEPSSFVLCGLGLIATGLYLRRRGAAARRGDTFLRTSQN